MDFGGFDFSEEFRRHAGGRNRTADNGGAFKDLFSNFFRSGGAEVDSPPEKGADLEYAVNIDFWQAIRGTQA
jgi:molecular chaperone DnaJ